MQHQKADTGGCSVSASETMRSINKANRYFQSEIKNTQTEEGAWSELQSLMTKLYCVARQCSTWAALLLPGSKTL